MLGKIPDWSSLDLFLPPPGQSGRRTGLASTFAATLELVRDGVLDLRQMDHFGPIFVKKREMTPANDQGN